eukprot:353543-Chlamydomonas_euryale.AAC.7
MCQSFTPVSRRPRPCDRYSQAASFANNTTKVQPAVEKGSARITLRVLNKPPGGLRRPGFGHCRMSSGVAVSSKLPNTTCDRPPPVSAEPATHYADAPAPALVVPVR